VARILVVEDEPDLRFILRRCFERAGHEVVDAGHGAAALDLVRACMPDLVVTDILMPVMDGNELIEQLHGEPTTAAIPIVAVSGDPHLAGAADVILDKPVLATDILIVVNELLAEREDRPHTRQGTQRGSP
jgi:CheY-like chemotaxis protein